MRLLLLVGALLYALWVEEGRMGSDFRASLRALAVLQVALSVSGCSGEDPGGGAAIAPNAPAPLSVGISEQIRHRYTNGPEQAYAAFAAPLVGPGTVRGDLADISASFFYVEGSPESSSVTIFVSAEGVRTGSAELDSLLAYDASWLDAGSHPQLRFQSRSVSLDHSGALFVRGDLTIKDITREATALVDPPSEIHILENGMATTDFRGQFSFSRSDFDLGVGTTWTGAATGLPVVLEDTVEIFFDIQAFRSTFEWLWGQVAAPLADGSRHPVAELYEVAVAGGMEPALEVWEELKARDPTTGLRTLANLGWLLNLSGRPDEAVIAYDLVLETEPEDVSTHYRRGDALTTAGRYEEAIEEYRSLLERLPDSAHLHQLLALLDRDPLTGAEPG